MNESLESANGSTDIPIDCSVSEYDWPEFKFVAGVRTFTAVISMVCAICVIFVIVAFKKFKFFPHRLILYLAVTVVLHSIAYYLGRVTFHDIRDLFDPHCQYFGGFLELYMAWTELIAIFCISVNIFCNCFLGIDTSKFEIVYVIFIAVVPISWCWIPYSYSAFGIQGPWCGIRIHTNSCEFYSKGNYLRFALWEIPLFTIFLLSFLVTILAIGIQVKKRLKEWEGHRYDQQKQEAKQKVLKSVRPLLFYPLIYLILKTPLFAGDLYQTFHPTEPSLTIWIVEAVASPLAGAVVVLAYAFDTRTRNLLGQRGFLEVCKACFQSCKCRDEDDVMDYNVEMDSMFGDSLAGEAARQAVYVRHKIQGVKLDVSASNPTFNIL